MNRSLIAASIAFSLVTLSACSGPTNTSNNAVASAPVKQAASPSPTATPVETVKKDVAPPKADIVSTAEKLTAEYKALAKDLSAVDAKFKDKNIQVTGKVGMTFSGSDSYIQFGDVVSGGVTCNFEGERPEFEKMTKGTTVTVQGRAKQAVDMNALQLYDCYVIKGKP